MNFLEVAAVANRIIELFPASVSPVPLNLLRDDFVTEYHRDRHREVGGDFPEIRAYEISDCYIYASGFCKTADGSVIHSRDIVSDYATDYLKKTTESNPLHFMNRSINKNCESLESKKLVVPLSKPGYHVYGHWLLDILPLVWLSQITADRIGIPTKDLNYLLPIDTPSWAKSMLHLIFDIEADQLIYHHNLHEGFHVHNALLISMTRFNDRIWWGMNLFSEFVLDAICKDTATLDISPTIFISRLGVKSAVGRSCVNEAIIQETAEKMGYLLISPEKLQWNDQVRIFRQSRCIAGLFGSGMHSTLFSTPLNKSVILANSHMNWIQSSIAGIRAQQIGYILPIEETLQAGQLIHSYDLDSIIEILDMLKR